MLDDTSPISLIVIIGLTAALIILCVVTVIAVTARDQALLELEDATQALHEVMWLTSAKEKLIAEELSRIERELGELERGPSTMREFRIQSF